MTGDRWLARPGSGRAAPVTEVVRPSPEPDEMPTRPFSVRLTEPDHSLIKTICKQRGITMNAFICDAISEKLGRGK